LLCSAFADPTTEGDYRRALWFSIGKEVLEPKWAEVTTGNAEEENRSETINESRNFKNGSHQVVSKESTIQGRLMTRNEREYLEFWYVPDTKSLPINKGPLKITRRGVTGVQWRVNVIVMRKYDKQDTKSQV
jgi:hypothetical protein